MSVVIIGGNERMVTQYENICKEHGCKAKVFAKEDVYKRQVVIPAKDCCKGEEYKAEHQDKGRKLCRKRKTMLECIGCNLNTFQTFYLPCTCLLYTSRCV